MTVHAPLYRFLARAYLAPPDEDFLTLAADVPELGRWLGGDAVAGDLATRYTWLFSFNVYPYASVFIDPSAMLNAPWSGFVAGVYRALGLDASSAAGIAAPDHLAAQLEAVAALLEREEGATDALAARRARHGQRTLLCEHLLPWLPIFLAAVERADDGFYRALATLTREVVGFTFPRADEAADPSGAGPRRRGAPGLPDELGALLVPARSGLFLSRADLTALGRRLELPIRFAERAFMLEHLVRSAAERDGLAALFGELGAAALAQREALATWSADHPVLAPLWTAWFTRLDATERALAEHAAASTDMIWSES